MVFGTPHQRSLVRGALARGWRRCAVVALILASGPAARAAEKGDWTTTAYHIQCSLAVDTSARPQESLEAALAKSIVERAEASLAPLWRLDLSAAQGAASRRQCFEPVEIPWDALDSEQRSADKLLYLGVRATPLGYDISCREFDVYLRRWGPAKRREISQSSYLAEGCFEMLVATFTPLATIEPMADNDTQVRLLFKGSQLPKRIEDEPFVEAGDVYAPLLRRTDRTGELVRNGIQPMPWTYLIASSEAVEEGGREEAPEAPAWVADVHTGMRRPFAAQRRGLMHQVAIALRNPPAPTQVRFHARNDESQGLAGYEVFRAASEDGTPEFIGKTDRQGVISIPPQDGAVTMILLRSEGQLLAKVPVPAGLPRVLQAPIADNVARLRASAESQVVREELVDVVARRAIMMARTRSLLKKGRIDEARQLMMQLDELPTSSTFGRSIEQAAKRIPATEDIVVQQRIDKLFSSTRELLSQFLNPRPIIELQSEVNAAGSAAKTTAEGTGA